MTWNEIKSSIQADLLSRGLADPRIRLNALKRIEKMLESCYPNFPSEFVAVAVAGAGRKEVASKLAALKATGRLNASEQSVLKMIFDRLEGTPPPPATLPPATAHVAEENGAGAATNLMIEDLSKLRRQLIGHVVALESAAGLTSSEGIGTRIGRLAREGVIPRDIAACMRVVTEARNRAEYEARNPSPALAAAVIAAWQAIEEWLDTR